MIGWAFWIVVAALIYGIIVSYWVHDKVWLPAGALMVLGVTGYATGFAYGTWGFVVVAIVAGVVYASNALEN